MVNIDLVLNSIPEDKANPPITDTSYVHITTSTKYVPQGESKVRVDQSVWITVEPDGEVKVKYFTTHGMVNITHDEFTLTTKGGDPSVQYGVAVLDYYGNSTIIAQYSNLTDAGTFASQCNGQIIRLLT